MKTIQILNNQKRKSNVDQIIYHQLIILIQKNSQIMQKHFNSSFIQFLPNITSIDSLILPLYKQLTKVQARPQFKQTLKNYKKYLLNQQEPQKKNIIIKYLLNSILAEGIIGNIQFKFLCSQLIKILSKQLKTQNIILILPHMNHIDHYRNLSQFLDIIPSQVKNNLLFNQYYTLPLIQHYRNAIKKIQSESFSCKWLEVFIQITRSINSLVKFIDISTYKNQLINLTRKCINFASILRRDIITQLYLILLSLNPEQEEPQKLLNLIHYLHSQALLFNKPILKRLLQYTSIPQTQTKFHLLYGLLVSLEKQYQQYDKNQDVFSKIIQLYEIGRTAYTIIEDMFKIILKFNGKWHLNGYLSRKFFIAKCVLKNSDNLSLILQKWPKIFQQSIQNAGNLLTPFAIDCVQIILQKHYSNCKQNSEQWTKYWLDSYMKYFLQGSKLTVRGIIQQINPIITRICKQPILLKYLINYKQTSSIDINLGIISLLKCYKQNGLIFPNNDLQSYNYKQQNIKQKINIQIKKQSILDLLLSNDTNISLKTFEFITITQRPSDLILPFQYSIILQFFKYCTRTSSSQFRRSYLNVIRKLFQRLRLLYQRDILLNSVQKKTKVAVKYLQQFKQFINQLISLCFNTLYPDVPFQIINPALETLHMIFNYFGIYEYEIRKGTNLSPSNLLLNLKNVFTLSNFNALIICLSSSFENVRSLAFNIMYLFPIEFQGFKKIIGLWQQCVYLTNKLIIKNFETGAKLIKFIHKRYSKYLKNIETKFQVNQLNLYYYLLKLMKQRFIIFKKQFQSQSQQFNSNLVHGINTCYAYLFQQFAVNIKNNSNYYSKYSHQIKQFFQSLFIFLKEVITFAVQISSANVSTVVLDSSQSKLAEINSKKLKVDCRGHFIKQNQNEDQKTSFLKNVQNMLSGATLMTSMGDDDQSNQNTLVVSFYLLTRQSGLLFQSISSVVQNDVQNKFVSSASLIQIINSYFYALVNLKHMGSVDRISQGLQKMAKAIYKKQQISLNSLPQILLNKLLQLLQQSKFTNILRRSAGIPYAFTCLLKSQALRRKYLVETTMKKLFNFAKNQNPKLNQLKIHSLNILKKIFQDSDLKFDLDPFVSEAFIISMNGFSTQQWGVRNSALMLFSTLSLRTLGTTPKLNLLQFFQKCPSLIQFFLQQLKVYIDKVNRTMYPPIYPITLLLSRLVPFDQSPSPFKLDSYEKQSKVLRKQDLKIFIPLLLQAGNTVNYMGRVMIGKALHPFMDINQILDFCFEILKNLQYKKIRQNHNKAHSSLLIVYNLIKSYYRQQNKRTTENRKLRNVEIEIFNVLKQKIRLIQKLKCPLVQQIFLRIVYKFIKKVHVYLQKQQEQNYKLFRNIFQQIGSKYLQQNLYSLKNFRFQRDYGDSVLRLTLIKLYIRLNIEFNITNVKFDIFIKILQIILTNTQTNQNYFNQIDNQVIQLYLNQLKRFVKSHKKTHLLQLQSKYQTLLQNIVFSKAVDYNLNSCIKCLQILKYFNVKLNQSQINLLNKRQISTLNPHLKITIFKFLNKTGIQAVHMFQKFSKAEQLISFRIACVKYIKQFNVDNIYILVRLLDDQDQQIRKITADKLAEILKIPQYNETKIKQIILYKLRDEDIQKIIQDGDVITKRRNDIEQRIFSYDKANKYRSDILNIVSLIDRIKKIKVLQKEQRSKQILKVYGERIFMRNEYKFEVILRGLINGMINNQIDIKKYEQLDPILWNLIKNIK